MVASTSSPPGAEITTFFAPAAICADALALLVNKPVNSSTKSTPSSPQGSLDGSRCATTRMRSPFTTIESPSTCTSPRKRHGTAETAVHGIETRQMNIGVGVPQVVDRDHLDLVRVPALIECAQNIAADAPIAIDSHLDCHRVSSPFMRFAQLLTGSKRPRPKTAAGAALCTGSGQH